MAEAVNTQSFSEIRGRLDEIAKQVGSDDIALDTALDLYEEAVKLGMKATELLETIDAAEPSTDEETPAPAESAS